MEVRRSDEDAVSVEAAAETLRMLSGVMGSVPDGEWTPSLVKAVEVLGDDAPGCARMRRYLGEHAGEDDFVQALAVDWTLAFRGVSPAHGPRPPYAGAWLGDDGTGVGVMLAVNSCYVAEGLGTSGSKPNRLDYLGVELEFMAHLLSKAAAGGEGAREAEASLSSFIDRYVLSWLPRYRAQVEERCKTEFWKGFLELTESAVREVRAALSGDDGRASDA